jgi:hypothetical protein
MESEAGMAASADTAAHSGPAIEVAQAAELTGLSKDAIRGRIRRGALASRVHKGRHRIPLAELQRQGLLVEHERYASAQRQVASLEADLRAAHEGRDRAERELHDLQETLRWVWGMVRQKEHGLADLRPASEKSARIRRLWRRGASPPGPTAGEREEREDPPALAARRLAAGETAVEASPRAAEAGPRLGLIRATTAASLHAARG